MSGIEIAGLILGAIPIIVIALQQYKRTRGKLSNFGHKALYVDRLIDSLEEQKVLIEVDFCVLLRAIDCDYEPTNLSSYSQVFQDDEVTQELQDYLGAIYVPYRKALIRCEESLIGIATRISGLTMGSPVYQTNLVDLRDLVRLNSELSGKFVLGKRIKFNIKKDELDRLIKELNESGAMLTRLRASSKNIHDEITQTKSKRSIRFSLFLSQIRKHTLSLHMALSQGWKSGCHPQHNICLYLDGRTAPLRKAKSPIEFMLALPNPASIKTHQELQEIQVEVMEEEIAGTSSSLEIHTGKNQVPSKKARINFPLAAGPARKLGCICSTWNEGKRTEEAQKLLLSVQDNTLYTRIQATANHKPRYLTNDYITLESILKESPDPRYFPKRWNLNQRMVLAFKLASSLLQYHSTPWLGESWSKKAICFQRTQSPKPGVATLFEVDRPFITHTFKYQTTAVLQKWNAKRSLLELGVLLLEIFHEETLEDFASVGNIPLGDSYGQLYDVAKHWHGISAGEVPLLYWDAIELCIECPFYRSSAVADWNDVEFQKSVCEGVIKPLWENCPRQSR